jgi:methylglyoxal synthase
VAGAGRHHPRATASVDARGDLQPMPLGFAPLRIGLAASARHRSVPEGALFRLLVPLERTIREELRAELFVLGQTCEALAAAKVLTDYPRLTRLPARRDGGLIHLVGAVVSGDPGRRLDAVIYLLDPDDPTTVFPEGLALKRECVIHETLFISTLAHAREWFELARVECGFTPNPLLDTQFDFASQTIALVAHDARKDELVEFVRGRFTFFDRFRRRIATGTSGGLLNDLASGLSPSHLPWVRRFHSGPLGGDVEIALEILENRCRRVIFLEDPHVARQHEADIQLLERSAWTTTERTMCISDRASADAWVASCERRRQIRGRDPS